MANMIIQQAKIGSKGGSDAGEEQRGHLMHVQKINKPVFNLSNTHPARVFLDQFIECRIACVGKEIAGIEQEWFSEIKSRKYRFSSFAYEYLSFDIELDGWLKQHEGLTDSERQSILLIPQIEALVDECKMAANNDKNDRILSLCDKIKAMLAAWKDYIAFREGGPGPWPSDKRCG
jgi:disulfide oxidoreductase YuzD